MAPARGLEPTTVDGSEAFDAGSCGLKRPTVPSGDGVLGSAPQNAPCPSWRPGDPIWYSPTLGGASYPGVVDSEPRLLGGTTWVVRLRDMCPEYGIATGRTGRTTVAAAECELHVSASTHAEPYPWSDVVQSGPLTERQSDSGCIDLPAPSRELRCPNAARGADDSYSSAKGAATHSGRIDSRPEQSGAQAGDHSPNACGADGATAIARSENDATETLPKLPAAGTPASTASAGVGESRSRDSRERPAFTQAAQARRQAAQKTEPKALRDGVESRGRDDRAGRDSTDGEVVGALGGEKPGLPNRPRSDGSVVVKAVPSAISHAAGMAPEENSGRLTESHETNRRVTFDRCPEDCWHCGNSCPDRWDLVAAYARVMARRAA